MNLKINAVINYLMDLDFQTIFEFAESKGISVSENMGKERIVEKILSKMSEDEIKMWFKNLTDDDND